MQNVEKERERKKREREKGQKKKLVLFFQTMNDDFRKYPKLEKKKRKLKNKIKKKTFYLSFCMGRVGDWKDPLC